MKICAQSNKAVAGFFDLAFIEDYATKGFGPVENSDPAVSYFLESITDRSGYLSSHLGTAVTDFISGQLAGAGE